MRGRRPSLGLGDCTDRNDLIFQDTRPQPFLDQADDVPVADPVFQETDQPLLADLIEESSARLPITVIFRIR